MRVAYLLTGILLTAAPMSGTESLKINVSPSQATAPANLRIRVMVEPNAANRSVTVAAESDDFFRSSEVALEGDQGPRTIYFEFRGVPGGQYEVRGAVGDAMGHEVASAKQNVFIMGSDADR
jgi:uncharacterized protein (DUF58 family)